MLDDITSSPVFKGELKPGMVFIIHPITLPSDEADAAAFKGHGGHMIGDTYIVTEGEPESVCKIPFDVTIV